MSQPKESQIVPALGRAGRGIALLQAWQRQRPGHPPAPQHAVSQPLPPQQKESLSLEQPQYITAPQRQRTAVRHSQLEGERRLLTAALVQPLHSSKQPIEQSLQGSSLRRLGLYQASRFQHLPMEQLSASYKPQEALLPPEKTVLPPTSFQSEELQRQEQVNKDQVNIAAASRANEPCNGASRCRESLAFSSRSADSVGGGTSGVSVTGGSSVVGGGSSSADSVGGGTSGVSVTVGSTVVGGGSSSADSVGGGTSGVSVTGGSSVVGDGSSSASVLGGSSSFGIGLARILNISRGHHAASSAGYSSASSSPAPSLAGVGTGPAVHGVGKPLGRGALVAQFILNAQKLQERERGKSVHAASVVSTTTAQGSTPSEMSAGETSELASTLGCLQLQEEREGRGSAVVMKGSFGTKFTGTGNWLRLFLDPRKEVFEYAVFFEPDVDARNLRFKLLAALHEHIGNVKSFDGAKLWLPQKLNDERTILHTANPLTGGSVTVRLDLKRRTEMSQCVQLYNVLFSRVMRQLQMTKVGLSYYLPGARFLVPQHKLEIWPGYVTAAHYMEGGVMLCVDTSHRVLRTTTAHEIMTVAARANPSDYETWVRNAVVGSVVLTRYNNRTYIVDDIMFDQTPQASFTNSRGETLTYIQYYKQQYNIDIRDVNQPLFVHKLKKKEIKDMGECKLVCLIPELCYMTGLTDEMRSDFRVMKDIAQHTRLSPEARQECLAKFVKNVNDTPEACGILSAWGLTLDAAPLKLEGRLLPPEVVVFGNGREVSSGDKADFSVVSARERVLMPVDLTQKQWLLLFTGRDDRTAAQFVHMLGNVCRPLGIRLGNPVMVRLPQDRADAYVAGIRDNYNKQVQLAVVVFPSQREDRYNAVKRVGCAELGLPTQCIIARTIANEAKLRSVTVKIALQINCKLGGELWALKIPMAGLMVCGIDVYHDPLRKGASVASFVSSTNSTMTRWYSLASFQHPGDEIVNGLKVALLGALRQYHQVHESLPKSIIVYRDGVSDGQLFMVRDFELPQLMSVFRNFDGYEPKLSIVVVQKRINTRIYAALSGRGLDNPPPGSIIDHTITKRDWYDFLLVSQHVRQGTVSPTHYVVVHDGVGLKVDNMQRLTYKLTHLYYNWPGTIRVPAPCQYAHKLSYLVGQNVRKPTHQLLRDRLFYL